MIWTGQISKIFCVKYPEVLMVKKPEEGNYSVYMVAID